ncbi:MAG TPA: nucleotidyltransferase family protein [Clostridia bacterium]|nr:nucleotidyltransferase family protein [Clostridia bacterium]
MKLGGLILAAGLSSRMGDFKPLMRIGEKTLVEHSVESLFRGGAQSVTVVLGFRAEEVQTMLKRAFPAQRVRFVCNDTYGTTDMLASIKKGLPALSPCDAFFLLPGDMPAVSENTLYALSAALENTGVPIAIPTVDGRRKHPPLIRACCIEDILSFEGEDGLRGIWRGFEGRIAEIAVDDRGCLLDADRMDDFLELSKYLKKRMISDADRAGTAELDRMKKEGCRI